MINACQHLAVVNQALAEALTAEAEGRVMSLEDAAAQVKAKIRDAAARRAKACVDRRAKRTP